jgi:TRAP-type mannitol/chloroaromatic compound transport system permease small subunit
MSEKIVKYIDAEVEKAEKLVAENDLDTAFHHLERAHVLGQAITYEHTRVHFLMLKVGWRRRDWREIFGQIFRILGASTKTPFGIYPTGNTGGANVSPFRKMPVSQDLEAILRQIKEV